MKAETIIEVVDKLIGEVDAVGSTHIDDERFENLKVMEDLVDAMIVHINYASKTKDYPQYSMAEIGENAFNYLKDLAGFLTEITGETE